MGLRYCCLDINLAQFTARSPKWPFVDILFSEYKHIYALVLVFLFSVLSDWLTAKRFERTAILAFGRAEKLIKITNGNEWKNLAGWKLDFEYFMPALGGRRHV